MKKTTISIILLVLPIISVANNTDLLSNAELTEIKQNVKQECIGYTLGNAKGMLDFQRAMVETLTKHSDGISDSAWNAFVNISPTITTKEDCFNQFIIEVVQRKVDYKTKLQANRN